MQKGIWLYTKLAQIGACDAAIEWLKMRKIIDAAEAWAQCDDPEWLQWYLRKCLDRPAYDAAVAPARIACDAAVTSATAAYNAAVASADAAYNAAVASADAAYDAAVASARIACDDAVTSALAGCCTTLRALYATPPRLLDDSPVVIQDDDIPF